MEYKLEIYGGKLNGAHRYYKKLSTAIREAKKLKWTAEYESVFIEIYDVNDFGIKTFIKLINYDNKH